MEMTRKTAYGLELDGGYAVIVRARSGRRGVRYERVFAGETASPAFQDVAATLALEVSRGWALLAGAVDVSSGILRSVVAPFASVAKARRVFASLLDVKLPFAVESCEIRFVDERRGEGRVEALGVGVRNETLEALLGQYKDLGLDVEVVDHAALAVWEECLKVCPPESDRESRVIVWGGRHRSFIVRGTGAHLENAHGCGAGAGAASEEGQRTIVNRLHGLLKARGKNPDAGMRVLCVGPEGGHDHFARALSNALHIGETLSIVPVADSEDLLARGLARRALTDGPLRCNFRDDGAFVPPGLMKARRRTARRAAVSLLLTGLFLCGLNVLWTVLLDRRIASVQQQLVRRAHELAPDAALQYGREVVAVEKRIAETGGQWQPFLRVVQPAMTRVLPLLMNAARAHGIHIESLSLRPDAVLVMGTSSDWNDCDVIIQTLEEAGYDMEPPERQDAGKDERVHFSVRGGGAVHE